MTLTIDRLFDEHFPDFDANSGDNGNAHLGQAADSDAAALAAAGDNGAGADGGYRAVTNDSRLHAREVVQATAVTTKADVASISRDAASDTVDRTSDTRQPATGAVNQDGFASSHSSHGGFGAPVPGGATGIPAGTALPTDPFFAQQWHLGNPDPALLDLNVRGVWDPAQGPAYTGAGIRTLVIDDGFDYLHQDFDNYDQNLDYNFDAATTGAGTDLDPFGLASDSHGTAVAGIIGAAADGGGAVGVAYGTSMVGYRVHGFINDDWLVDIRESIHHAAVSAQADVANISQGIANDLNSEFGVGYNALRFDEIETSIGTAVNSGRGGLGMTIVKSAGNSRVGNYDVNADDWTNDTRQVVVAAVDQNGFVSSYSSYGAAVLISGFGTPGEVITTDRTGAAGYNSTDFTFFNGTSAAAPMVAGVVALMYDANAALGWRDVQSILASSARLVGSEVGAGIAGSERYAWEWNASSTWNGGGMHFSNDYGYGLVDALAAVRMAETWLLGGASAQTSANEFTNSMDMLNVATVIPDGNATGLTFTGNAGFDDEVDRVTVQMTFSTTFTGDLEVYLTSPDGTVSRLINDTGGSNDFNGTWTFESQAFRGERAQGQWSVRVVDDAGGDVLNVSDIVVRTFGRFSSNDRYVFTNEYSDYDGVGGHLTAINDANGGGSDTVNAAAVTSNSTIRLDGAAGSIDGVGVTFANIEHAIGGDGNDSIYGNGGVNSLWGMRGNDVFFIQDTGDQVFELIGQGDDTVRSTVNYALAAGSSIELLRVTNPGTVTAVDLTGNEFGQTLIGNAGANSLDGGGGADTMNGLGGDDFYFVDNIGDVVIAGVGAGNDRVLTSVSFAAGSAEIEMITTTNSTLTTAIDLTGNNFVQMLIGNAGVNNLDGGGGADTMNGLGGDDFYFVDNIGDLVVAAAGAGNDRVLTSVTYSLAASAEIETFSTTNATFTTAIDLIGNGFAQTLIGNAGSNNLNGGGGADTMNGLGGDDFYYVDNLGDVAIDAAGSGNDRVLTSAHHTLAGVAAIEMLTTTNTLHTANLQLTGNNFGQTIIGNAGHNTLAGRGGIDILNGGLGNDFFVFDTALGAGNVDTIAGYAAANDTVRLDDAIFTQIVDNASGFLASFQFVSNATGLATNADHRVLYENDTGSLFYDADGTGATAGIQFATLSAGLAMTHTEFFVI